MNSKLKQAINATRSGQSKDAQILLTQVLKDDPDNAQAWYLLSLLVDSPTKKQAYLQKATALDPAHERAQQQLDQLTTSPIETSPEPIISTPDTDLAEQAESDALPAWLTDMQPADAPASLTLDGEEQEAAAPSTEDEIPDWLKDTFADNWSQAEQPTLVSEPRDSATSEGGEIALTTEDYEEDADIERHPKATQTVTPAKTTPTTPAAPQKSASTTNMDRILYILIAGAFIIFLLLIYFLFIAA